ncbi:MAG: protein-tyrosine-phosphatase [Rhodospirillales bacterium]|nr:protein-tyrosine-phosphatase [Rhodospirillales bacterium]
MNTEITNPRISHPLLPYSITICGLSELRLHADAGVSHVISILDPAWPDPQDFHNYGAHTRVLWRFDDVVNAIRGYSEPQRTHVEAILELGDTLQREPVTKLLIHCHAGVSRSTATAIILMTQRNPGREQEAFDELVRLRPRSWPNALMLRHADELLRREGALIAALRRHQAQIARHHPEFAELLVRCGRAHEIAALDDRW